jgi:hypothetical protein
VSQTLKIATSAVVVYIIHFFAESTGLIFPFYSLKKHQLSRDYFFAIAFSTGRRKKVLTDTISVMMERKQAPATTVRM